MRIDDELRELTLKVVYYGPARAGKTSNLMALSRMAPRGTAGRLTRLESADKQTLFADILPMHFQIGAYGVGLMVLAVPGGAMHDSTRRVVLRNVDGIVFVASSARDQMKANHKSYHNLRTNLGPSGPHQDDISVVMQFNKRDLEEALSEDEMLELERQRGGHIFRASAEEGKGVVESLAGVLAMIWHRSEELRTRLATDEHSFIEQLFRHWDRYLQKGRERERVT